MRKAIVILLLPFILASCGNNSEVEKIKAERDSLQNIANNKDMTINDFLKSFNEIESNLETIKQKENIISLKAHGDIELDQTDKDKINDDILAIYELMNTNKKTINNLRYQLKKANIKESEFNKIINRLTQELEQKNEEIELLKNNLAKLNIDVENLNQEIAKLNENLDTLNQVADNQSDLISIQEQKLNTAYFVYGTKKELKENKVITLEGGFIGIGRMEKLMDNFNKDYFKIIDIRKTTSIRLVSKKAELITTHPANSYYFAGNDKIDSLVIRNPKEFWSVSKYLVIMVN
ncbi:MAG: hypothetical protein JXR51_16750 [Bacteroidales bacterium]|nr:hypothetical protein [Bacteroidales bacterium]MBN2758818.1 hypothetical protein [Bacteroidales bacterium]